MARGLKRGISIALLLCLLTVTGAVLWQAAELPPVRLLVEHGAPFSSGGPTGRRMTIEGVQFIELSPGYFRMGSWERCDRGTFFGRVCHALRLPWGRQPREEGDEVPVRWVELPRGYWLAVTEVTNGQYELFDPDHNRPETSPGDRDPVVEVTFHEVEKYCEWLSERGGLTVRLPSETEWEYACRAGELPGDTFDPSDAGAQPAPWHRGNSRGRAHEVGSLPPNRWGLHDMLGNAWEWCADTYSDSYEGAPIDGNPRIDGNVPFRVDRGGGWNSDRDRCRPAARSGVDPERRSTRLGFRPAAEVR